VVEIPEPIRLLPGAAAPQAPSSEPADILELRALRAGRHRWD
jgi:hypothetical protein